MEREGESAIGSIADNKPHIVLVPGPSQGHVGPVLKLANLFHTYGFHITVVNTELYHSRLLKSPGLDALGGLPDFRFEAIPDGLPPPDDDATLDIPSLCKSTTTKCLAPFRDLLLRLNDPSSGVPPVTCVITDAVMTFAIDAAKELGIVDVLFWTASACGYMCFLHYQELIDRGLFPLKDESDLTNGYMDTPVEWIPGLKNMRLKDIPSFIHTTNRDDIILNFFLHETKRAYMSSAFIFHTFDDLEREVLEALAKILPPCYAIGPLGLLSLNMPSDGPLASVGASLWKEDEKCIPWLDSKEPESIVYVNFGSIATMTSDNLVEFAWGLANSNANFLWIVRPDLVEGGLSAHLEEFIKVTKGRGLLTSWCDQEAVLVHPSLGGFLTHCGWNSALETISGGVPTLCWPFCSEQQTNCRYLCTEWGIGMEIDNVVKRGDVERIVRELMEGEKGKEMRRRALEWKESAHKAAQRGGTSMVNLERVIKEVILAKKSTRLLTS